MSRGKTAIRRKELNTDLAATSLVRVKRGRSACALLLTVAVAGLLALTAFGSPAPAADKAKKKAHAVLFVSVFNEDGFSLPGVRLSVKRKGERKPKWKGVTDRRGEAAVRLPAEPGTYEVTTHSKKFVNETKTVEMSGQERVDIFFRLSRRKKK